jgi:hypothetical protein
MENGHRNPEKKTATRRNTEPEKKKTSAEAQPSEEKER